MERECQDQEGTGRVSDYPVHSSLLLLPGEGGRERAQDGRRESKRVQEREVYGTVSFLPPDITELEYALEAALTFCPTETWRDLTKSWTVRGSFHRGSNLRQLSPAWSPRDSHSGAENELSGECVCCSHCCMNALSWLY